MEDIYFQEERKRLVSFKMKMLSSVLDLKRLERFDECFCRQFLLSRFTKVGMREICLCLVMQGHISKAYLYVTGYTSSLLSYRDDYFIF